MKFIRRIFLTIILFILVVAVCPLSFNFDSPKKNNASNLVYESFKDNQDVYVKDIAMLGAHDAFSSNINLTSKLDPCEDGIYSKPVIGDIIKGLTIRLSKTQLSGSYDLLTHGVRYFDVRLSYVDNEWYTKHVYLSDRLETYVLPMIKFLSENKGEIVIFDIQHAYLQDASYSTLWSYLANLEYNGISLLDFVNYNPREKSIGELKYRDVTLNGTKSGVIILAKDSSSIYHHDYNSSIRSSWHDKVRDEDMFAGIENEYEYLIENSNSYDDVFVVNQAQKTAQLNEQIVDTLFGWSLIDLANNFNAKLLDHIDFMKWFEVMPILMVDYSDSPKGDFNERVINKIKEYNATL